MGDQRRRQKIFVRWLKKKKPGMTILGNYSSKRSRPEGAPTRGWPDFAVRLKDGTLAFYEVKARNQTPHKNQKD